MPHSVHEDTSGDSRAMATAILVQAVGSWITDHHGSSTSSPVQAISSSDASHHGSRNNSNNSSTGTSTGSLVSAVPPTTTAGEPPQNQPALAMLNTWQQELDRGLLSTQETLFAKYQAAGNS